MSCGCNTPTLSNGCSTTSSAQPRRVGSQPVVPITQPWAGQLRSAFEIELIGRSDTELLTLDGGFNGQVLYDANTRKAYVGNLSATYVADNYPCQDATMSGMLVYAKDPGCRDLGSNPDRELMVVRPISGSTGFLFGHEHSCPSGPTTSPELRPVEIEPIDLPNTFPDGLYTLCYVKTSSNDSCSPATYQWYRVSGQLPISKDSLNTTEITTTDFQDVTDGFNLAGWRLVNNKWISYRITNESFKKIIVAKSSSPTVWLTIPYQVLFQSKMLHPAAQEYFPSEATPSGLPIINQTQVVNLTTLPNYFEEATSVKVEFQLLGITLDQFWYAVLVANGREYARITLHSSYNSDSSYNQVDIPFHGDTNMDFRFYYQQYTNDTPVLLRASISIVAFNR